MKKALVIGVILLFLGVGFQPALANEVSTTTTSDVDEDCGCQPVNRVDLLKVKLLLIRLEVFTNIILSRFGHIPEIEEKCHELLNIVNSDSIRDIFCGFIEVLVSSLFAIGEILDEMEFEILIIMFSFIIIATFPFWNWCQYN